MNLKQDAYQKTTSRHTIIGGGVGGETLSGCNLKIKAK